MVAQNVALDEVSRVQVSPGSLEIDSVSEDETDDLNDSPTPVDTRLKGKQPMSVRDGAIVISSDSETQSEHEVEVQRQTSSSASRRRHKRLDFSDDENFGRSRRTTAGLTSKRKAKDATVGRRVKSRLKTAIDEVDSDEYDKTALLEDSLPDYLRQRLATLKKMRSHTNLQDALVLPPDYDDVDFSGDDRIASLAERPQFTHIRPVREYKDIKLTTSSGVIPAPIARWLRDYQVQGAEFLHQAFVYQKGVILGDDMGLGKTIQVISFLTAAFGKTGDERDAKRMRKIRRLNDERWYPTILIICPGAVLMNWQAELQRWGWWTIYQYHGQHKQDALDAANAGRLEIMITTYQTYCKDATLINSIAWDCVIADECHILKNHRAKVTLAMQDVNALCRIGLTGTAIQNKYEELWTILNWANPGALGPLALWKTVISIPLRVGQSHSATIAQLAKARDTAEKLVNKILPAYFLRRMKTLIADQLPKKSDKIVFCPLTALQAEAYDNFCDSELVHVIRQAHLDCPCGSGLTQGRCCYKTVNGTPIKELVFPALMILQKLANHLALLVPSSEAAEDRHERELEFLKTAVPSVWQEMYTQRDSIRNYANQEYCGKWRVLKKMLKLWYESGDKVLVFSHSVRLLKMLYMLFQSTTSYTISYLDGALSYEARQAVVDEYNSSPKQFVFLISTKAGGVGLNITAANKVVVVDPNWNPAWDLQAQDRAYRIGQTRDVEVFRLVSAGTIEENVYARQIYKQQQANIAYKASAERRYFNGVQQDAHKGEIFGLVNLLAPQRDNIALRDVVHKTNIAETKAGVMIAGLDLEPAEDEEGLEGDYSQEKAISALAASIIDEPGARRREEKAAAKKKDPIQAVLDAAGVEYTHDNAQVIGTSKIETQISSRARRAGGDSGWNGERAFQQSQDMPGVRTEERLDDHNALTTKVVYRYNPPEDVRMRQFCSMAQSQGYNDVSEFALVVEGWTQEKRRKFLDMWYRERRTVLCT